MGYIIPAAAAAAAAELASRGTVHVRARHGATPEQCDDRTEEGQTGREALPVDRYGRADVATPVGACFITVHLAGKQSSIMQYQTAKRDDTLPSIIKTLCEATLARQYGM